MPIKISLKYSRETPFLALSREMPLGSFWRSVTWLLFYFKEEKCRRPTKYLAVLQTSDPEETQLSIGKIKQKNGLDTLVQT